MAQKKASRTPHRRRITLTSSGNRKLNELMAKTSARSASHAVENAIEVHHAQEFGRRGTM